MVSDIKKIFKVFSMEFYFLNNFDRVPFIDYFCEVCLQLALWFKEIVDDAWQRTQGHHNSLLFSGELKIWQTKGKKKDLQVKMEKSDTQKEEHNSQYQKIVFPDLYHINRLRDCLYIYRHFNCFSSLYWFYEKSLIAQYIT